MKYLNDKIGEILKKHKEGKEFFDTLDYIIRSDINITDMLYNRIKHFNTTIILSGRFGRAFINNYGKLLYSNNHVILVNGGIREGEDVELYVNKIYNNKCIFIDDSIYSGKTRDLIEKKLKYIDKDVKIETTYVIYDGMKKQDINVKSLYRYHGKE